MDRIQLLPQHHLLKISFQQTISSALFADMAEPKTWILNKTTSYPSDDFRLQLGQVLTGPRLP
jgi:hypothetical protein